MNEYNFAFFGTDLQGMSDPDEQAVREALASGKFSSVQTMWDRLHQGFLNHLVMLANDEDQLRAGPDCSGSTSTPTMPTITASARAESWVRSSWRPARTSTAARLG